MAEQPDLMRTLATSGNPLVDAEHLRLFRLFDRFRSTTEDQLAFLDCDSVLDQLMECGDTYFRKEEALMGSLSFPELDTHTKEHRSLMRRARQLRAQFDNGEEPNEAVFDLLRDWVLGHVLDTDRVFLDYLELIGQMESDAAEREAELSAADAAGSDPSPSTAEVAITVAVEESDPSMMDTESGDEDDTFATTKPDRQTSENRRRDPRYRCNRKVTIRLNGSAEIAELTSSVAASTIDVSATGIKLRSPTPLPQHSSLDLELRVEPESYQLCGEVKWVQGISQQSCIIGIELANRIGSDLRRWQLQFTRAHFVDALQEGVTAMTPSQPRSAAA